MTQGTVYQIGVDGLTGDDSGKIELASIFTSTCTTTAPIAITAPANAAVSASVAVAAASASGTTVDFYLDGELQATDTSPLRLDLDTTRSTNASHTLLAKAYAGSTLLGSSLPRTAQAANAITHDTDEFEPNNSSPHAMPITLCSTSNGRISSPADVIGSSSPSPLPASSPSVSHSVSWIGLCLAHPI